MTACIWPFKLKALQAFIHRPAASYTGFDLILTRQDSKCLFVFPATNQPTQFWSANEFLCLVDYLGAALKNNVKSGGQKNDITQQ